MKHLNEARYLGGISKALGLQERGIFILEQECMTCLGDHGFPVAGILWPRFCSLVLGAPVLLTIVSDYSMLK